MINLGSSCSVAASIIKEKPGKQFKFEDSSLVFETDGTFLYVSDFDSGEDLLDCILLCPDYVRNLFIDHNGKEYATSILKSLTGFGLLFSDKFNNSDIDIESCIIN